MPANHAFNCLSGNLAVSPKERNNTYLKEDFVSNMKNKYVLTIFILATFAIKIEAVAIEK